MGTSFDPGSFDLSGRIALITGGTRGIGRQIAFTLARAGAEVIVVSRKTDACDHTAEEVADETGRQATLARNVRTPNFPSTRAYATAGRIDILVNNAGSSLLYDDVSKIDEAMFDKMIALNLKGPFRLTALIGTRMAAGGSGSVVNVSTISASVGRRTRSCTPRRRPGSTT